MKSIDFANLLLEKTGIIVTPGIGYGEYGEGYVRIALTVDEKRLEEALERIKNRGLIKNNKHFKIIKSFYHLPYYIQIQDKW